jgi:hypothetical protein
LFAGRVFVLESDLAVFKIGKAESS